MKLKSKWFVCEADLIKFVTNNMTKENIQAITGTEQSGYRLFYWTN